MIADVYREKGVSGATDSAARPAWVEMVGLILANGIKTVIIEKLDRLARDLIVQEHIIADLQRRGIALISAEEPDLCSNEPTRKLMRQIMGAIAEYDRQMIVLKLRGARQRKRDSGARCEGRKPYGFRPGESAIVDRIKLARRAGQPFAAIAASLNVDGVLPRSDEHWHPFTVARIAARAALQRHMDEIPTLAKDIQKNRGIAVGLAYVQAQNSVNARPEVRGLCNDLAKRENQL